MTREQRIEDLRARVQKLAHSWRLQRSLERKAFTLYCAVQAADRADEDAAVGEWLAKADAILAELEQAAGVAS